MSVFPVHTIETAPEQSKPAMKGVQKELGMIPNLAATMAESPELLQGFLAVRTLMDRGTFRPGEVQVLALTNAFENGCPYCLALHSTIALSVGVPRDVVDALRAGGEPKDAKLGALSRFSRLLVKQRGQVERRDVDEFLAAGYSSRQALEVVLQIAASIMPNFARHLTEAPLDDAFAAELWEHPTHEPAGAAM